MSTAPDLAARDGLSSFERAARQPLMLGLFLPHQSGAWTPSTASRGTSWTFEYNAELAVRAEEIGFDLVFALATWLGKGGYGGEMAFRGRTLDPFIASAAFAPLTRNVLLISTVHVLYGWHPLHLAKYGAVIDHISRGRWGLNIVTGYRAVESRMFGFDPIPHDERYARAEEFTTVMKQLWRAEEELEFSGRWYRTEGAFIDPKPVHGRPILVSAGSSPAGLDFATSHADIIFATTATGADPERACESLPERVAGIRRRAEEKGREVRVLVNPHVICRPTVAEAREWRDEILARVDDAALDSFYSSFAGGDQASWNAHGRLDWAVGGNIHLVGSPDRIVDWFVRLKAAGVDGVQVNFYDFGPDLDRFARTVLPLMHEAGLRNPEPAGNEMGSAA